MAEVMATDQDRAALDLLIRGFQVSRMIRLVADLEIADRIAPGGRGCVDDLASACGVLRGPLFRVLRALAAFGVFRVTPQGMVAHSPRSALLRRDASDGLHYAARFWTSPGSWHAWGVLDAALVGEMPHRVAWNIGRFEYLCDRPHEARIFDAFMANTPDARHRAFAEAYDFPAAGLVVDVGGGNGEALRQILSRFPALRGVVFDCDDVVAAIPPADRLDGRLGVESGSFFDRVPAGGDLYLLICVLHDWPDQDCLRILGTCRAAMGPDARLLVADRILEPDPARGPAGGYLSHVHMIAMFGDALERTEEEFRSLLEASDFRIVRLLPTASTVSIIEAVAA